MRVRIANAWGRYLRLKPLSSKLRGPGPRGRTQANVQYREEPSSGEQPVSDKVTEFLVY